MIRIGQTSNVLTGEQPKFGPTSYRLTGDQLRLTNVWWIQHRAVKHGRAVQEELVQGIVKGTAGPGARQQRCAALQQRRIQAHRRPQRQRRRQRVVTVQAGAGLSINLQCHMHACMLC